MSHRYPLLTNALGGLFVGLIVSGLCYLVVATLFDHFVAGLSFLVIMPAAVCATAVLLADPGGTRSLGQYLQLPLVMAAVIAFLASLFFGEGWVCIVMYLPIWLVSGEAGALLAWAYRRNQARRRQALCSVLVVIPFLALQLEAALPVPERTATVTRAIEIDAPAERIWPLLRGMADVRADEGRWNITQDLLGVPRPRGAWLEGEGPGAVRQARWAGGIAFAERITHWRPHREIAWRFDFAGLRGWDAIDPHLAPDGRQMRILDGGYRLTPLPDGRSCVELHTRYLMRTWLSGYAWLFGEWFLGDIEENLLATIKQRAEAPLPPV